MAKLNWQKLAKEQQVQRNIQKYGHSSDWKPHRKNPNWKPKWRKSPAKATITRAQRDKAMALIQANKQANNT